MMNSQVNLCYLPIRLIPTEVYETNKRRFKQ
jgi:hypothetical protein